MTGNPDLELKWRIVRRLFHCLLSIVVIYYWFPDIIIQPNIGKWVLLLIGGLIVLAIEVPRLLLGKQLPWGRPYELRRPASYAYASFGAILVLLFTPPVIGAPCIVAMAFADPIAGELRHLGVSGMKAGIATAISYGTISYAVMSQLTYMGFGGLILVILFAVIATISEQIDIGQIDDDFLMLVLPATAGMLIWELTIF